MAKKKTEKPTTTCGQCKHAYDPHERNYKGEFFMVKCHKFPWSKFMNQPSCDRFELK